MSIGFKDDAVDFRPLLLAVRNPVDFFYIISQKSPTSMDTYCSLFHQYQTHNLADHYIF